jgi:hypothetical protein
MLHGCPDAPTGRGVDSIVAIFSNPLPLLGEIGSLTEQMAETARNGNEVMAHSLAVVKKSLSMSETTLEALKEHK